MNETIGESFTRPYNQASGALYKNEQTKMLPQRLKIQQNAQNIRLSMLQGRLAAMRQAHEDRMRQMATANDHWQQQFGLDQQKLGLDTAKFNAAQSKSSEPQTIAEFNASMRGAPPEIRAQATKEFLANNAGAMDENGYIDKSKLGKSLPLYMAAEDARLKNSMPATTYQKYKYAEAMEQTMSALNPSTMMAIAQRYSGIKGKEKFAQDRSLDQVGKAPAIYKQYQAYTNVVQPLLANEEIGNFLGTSIQPEAREATGKLADIDTWKKSPQTAMNNLMMLQTVLHSDMVPYLEPGIDRNDKEQVEMLNSYKGEAANANLLPVEQSNQETTTQAGKASDLPDGVTEKDVDDAMKLKPGASREQIINALSQAMEN